MNETLQSSNTVPFHQSEDGFSVVCLCAEWCGTCRSYKTEFDQLSRHLPGVEFRWVDIEKEEEDLGDLDVENFPTILIRRSGLILFFGTILPQIGHLKRLIEVFVEQTPAQSAAYAHANQERSAWQKNADLACVGSNLK